ncbi:hypothetical protein SAMN05421666_1036 [Roseovarius nanhaiticus]|uniref:Uncharacterized protein n=2 Tax=Roseovarius nanhaiticus TaxID=573024 RepID=A0A1N7FGR7_9RHOB|nr:hypothetical protein SAMN05216208_1100 [Roseovarius nanhaiticus]SIR99628.1 hypothetical protein SAMN05421666_1036 [Roseovarius nanhaiticus]
MRAAYGLDGAETAMRVAFPEMEAFKAVADRQALVGKSVADALSPYQNAAGRIFEKHREIAESLRRAVDGYPFHNFDFDRLKTDLTFSKEFQAAAERLTAANTSVFKGIDLDGLGADLTFGKEFQAAAERLTAANASAFKGIDLDLSVNIGDLLARSIDVQEALLVEQRAFYEEQREAAEVAKAEARFSRRMAYVAALISVLSLLFMIALEIEERWRGTDAAERAEDRAEIVQMRKAIETVGEQLAEMQKVEEERAEREDAEAAREAKADAELAAIMRDIADGLRDAEEDTDDD